MKNNINNELDQLRKSVWSLTRDTLQNIKSTLEKLDIDALETLQSQVEIINNLPSLISTNESNIADLQNNKVDKIEGKQLSSNDFTNEEKLKLASLGTGSSGATIPEGIVIDDNYVHTDNNYTDLEKQKLAGVEENANYTVLPDNLVADANYHHTENNFSDDYKNKLDSIEYGANYTFLPPNLVIDEYYNHTDHNFSEADKNKLDGIDLNANNYVLPSDVARRSDILNKLSQMEEDSTHRVITDEERTNWNGKADASGFSKVATSGLYTDLTGIPIDSIVYDGGILTITLPASTEV